MRQSANTPPTPAVHQTQPGTSIGSRLLGRGFFFFGFLGPFALTGAAAFAGPGAFGSGSSSISTTASESLLSATLSRGRVAGPDLKWEGAVDTSSSISTIASASRVVFPTVPARTVAR